MELRKVEVSTLKEAALDWAFAQVENVEVWIAKGNVYPHLVRVRKGVKINANYTPSTSPVLVDEIVKREKISTEYDADWDFDPEDPDDNGERWMATIVNDMYSTTYGATPAQAVARCWVRHKAGAFVDVPVELL